MGLKVRTMAEMAANGEQPEILFWVGCSGSFDERNKRITRAFAKILNHLNVNFAVLGKEESCTGDPARRAGNEFEFQMLAQNNIQILNGYGIKRIVTACPHCFNIIKNEYPALGGDYKVVHHSQFLQEMIASGQLKVNGEVFKNNKVTFHDPCYLGRGNGEYEAPRDLILALKADLTEMKRSKDKSLCCGAGGAQMFKEPEQGNKDINIERTEEVIETGADVLATGCPFCMTMMADGMKTKGKQMKIMDLAELIAEGITD